jgi:2-dehydropantoate 2-reductase
LSIGYRPRQRDKDKIMRIVIMGTGGTGGYFGGLLAQAGEDVTCIARGSHLEAICACGLTVKSGQWGDVTLRVEATDDPSTLGQVDVVLFCVKTYDTEAAAQHIRPLIGPDTMVLSVQNGIDSPECLVRMVGPQAVVGAAAYVSSVIESPGVISHRAGGHLIIGELDGGTSPRTEQLRTAFERARIPTELHPNIWVALWEKFVAICGFSGVTALMRLPAGPILACPESSTLYQSTLEEVEAVARATGLSLSADIVERSVVRIPAVYGSMYYDLVAGRRMELEALQGTVVRLGQECGIPVPMNFAIYAALKPYAAGTPTVPS